MDQFVANAGPLRAHRFVADVMRHRRGSRRKNSQIRAALTLQLQLRVLQALAQLVIADAWRCYAPRLAALEGVDLRVAKGLQLLRRRRVMAMAIDDHRGDPGELPAFRLWSSRSSVRIAVRHCATLAFGSRCRAIAAKNSRSCNSMPFIETSTLDTSIWLFLPSNRSS